MGEWPELANRQVGPSLTGLSIPSPTLHCTVHSGFRLHWSAVYALLVVKTFSVDRYILHVAPHLPLRPLPSRFVAG